MTVKVTPSTLTSLRLRPPGLRDHWARLDGLQVEIGAVDITVSDEIVAPARPASRTNSPTEVLRPQATGVPFAPRTPLTEPFWTACGRGELLFQRCAACAAPGFPPAVACRVCLARELRWERSTGNASLYSWTVVRRPVSPAFRTPYAPTIVTLDEGYQMMTCLVGLTVAAIRPDLRLRVAFHRVHAVGDPDGQRTATLPYFAPVGSA